MCRILENLYKIDLTKLHTKQLLKMLHSYSLCYDEYNNDCTHCNIHDYHNIIKAELAKRPHILNKKESKVKRKLLKKQGN